MQQAATAQPGPSSYVLSTAGSPAYLSVDSSGTFSDGSTPMHFAFIPADSQGNVVRISVNGAAEDPRQTYLTAGIATQGVTLTPYSPLSNAADSLLWEIKAVPDATGNTVHYTIKSQASSTNTSYYLQFAGGTLNLLTLTGTARPSVSTQPGACWKLWQNQPGTKTKQVWNVTAPPNVAGRVLMAAGDSVLLGSYMEYMMSDRQILSVPPLSPTTFFNEIVSLNLAGEDSAFLTLDPQNVPVFSTTKPTHPYWWIQCNNNNTLCMVLHITSLSTPPQYLAPAANGTGVVVLTATGADSLMPNALWAQPQSDTLHAIKPATYVKSNYSEGSDEMDRGVPGNLLSVSGTSSRYFLYGNSAILHVIEEEFSGTRHHYTLQPADSTTLFYGWTVNGTSLYLVEGDSLKKYDLGSITASNPPALHSVVIDSTSAAFSAPVYDADGRVFVLDDAGNVYGYSSNFSQTLTGFQSAKAGLVPNPQLFIVPATGAGSGPQLCYYTGRGTRVRLKVVGTDIVFADSSAGHNTPLEQLALQWTTRQANLPSPVNQWTNTDLSGHHHGQFAHMNTLGDSTFLLMTHHDSILGHSLVDIFLGPTADFPGFNFPGGTITPVSKSKNLLGGTLVFMDGLGHPLTLVGSPLVQYSKESNAFLVYALCRQGSNAPEFRQFSLAAPTASPARLYLDWYRAGTSVTKAATLHLRDIRDRQQQGAQNLDRITRRWYNTIGSDPSGRYMQQFIARYYIDVAPIPANPFYPLVNWMNYNLVTQTAPLQD